MLVRDRLRAKDEDGRIDLAGIDVANANAAIFLLRADADAERRHAELGSSVGDAAERGGALARNRDDVDNDAVLAGDHARNHRMDAIKRAIEVGTDEPIPCFWGQLAEGA